MNERSFIKFAGLLIGLASGCAVGPDKAPAPATELPARYAEASGPVPGVATTEPAADYAFWRGFGDPVLASLVERALKDSPDAALAAARLREAGALAGVAKAALFPSIDGNSRLRYEGYSAEVEGPDGTRLGDIPGFERSGGTFLQSFSMAYEVDIWGKNRRNHEAALADLGAEVERRRATGLSLAGAVAQAYIDHRILERRRAIAESALEARRTSLALTQARLASGLGTDVDVARAEGEAAAAEAVLPDLDRQMALAEHRLSILAGRAPGAVRDDLARTSRARAEEPLGPLAPVPAGLPASLVKRRPDVRAAALKLAAATARIGAAKADLLPQITLVGEIGLQASDAAKLARSAAGFWSVGPSVTVPLFDAGRRLDRLEAVEARAAGALAELETSILEALGEAEGALATLREEVRRRDRLAAAAAASARAADLARARYEAGTAAYFEVIDANRALYDREDALAESDRRYALAAVRLGKAVAGGYAEEALLARATATE